MNRHTAWLLPLICLFLSTAAFAQTAGRIAGTVRDATDARVPAARVTVTEAETGLERAAQTNEDGNYVVTNLEPGTYTISVELAGFKRFVKAGNVLVSDGRLTVDATLETGAVTETISVTAEAGETVNSTSGEIARVIDAEQVTNLALNGRNFVQLASLIPGAPLLDFDAIAQTTSVGQGSLSINGNRSESNNLTVDGGYNLSRGNQSGMYNNVGIDFIQEVRIQTSNFSAEHGRQGGAAINVTTKGGTNKYHGSLFEFLRNDKLDARNFFATDVRKLRFNDFGGGIGGPIKRNKFFFFAGLEWKRIRRTQDPARRTMPTLADLSGDLSFRLRGADGVVGTADDGALRDPARTGTCSSATRTACFPGNIIPANRITADGRAIANVYRTMLGLASSHTGLPGGNNTVYEMSAPFDFRQEIVRLDYKFNQKHSIYGRFLHDDTLLLNPFGDGSGLPTYQPNTPRDAISFALSHTWLISPTLVNEARANASRADSIGIPAGDTWKRETYGFAFTPLFNDGIYPNSIPEVQLNGFAGFNGTSGALASDQRDYTITDNLTIIRGNHNVKTGVLLLHSLNNQEGRTPSYYAGIVNFNVTGNTVTTNNVIGDMLLGQFRTYQENTAPPVTHFRATGIEAYVSDSFRLSKRLSIEAGVRYQYLGAMYTQQNVIATFDPARYDPAKAVTVNRDGTLVADSGNFYNGLVRAVGKVTRQTPLDLSLVPALVPRGLYEGPHRWAPRFSFAYAPFNNNKTAIRGGFGVYHQSLRGDLTQRSGDNPPFTRQGQYENQNLANIRTATLVPFGAVTTLQPNFGTPYTMNFSLSVQREMWKGVFLETAYVGNLGRHLTRQPDINQAPFADLAANAALPAAQRASVNFLRPYKGYSAINQFRSDSNSNYNALQLYVTKRKGRMLFTGSYTWGKALTDASGSQENPENFLDRDYNYGPASFDRRQIFSTTYTYTFPRFTRLGKPGHWFISNWEVSGITRFQAGNGATPTGTTSIGARRADYLGGVIELPKDERTPQRYFNTAAFDEAPNERRGSAGVRMIPGPGLQVWDVSLRKRFVLGEGWRLQFQGDFFNVFNKANFTGLNVNVSNAEFGSVTTAAPGRNIQLGLKLTF